MKPANEQWIERSVALLEQSAQALDAATLVRLSRARHLALSQRRRPTRNWVLGSSLAGAALALVVALGVAEHRTTSRPDAPDALAHDTTEAANGGADEGLDLYENLDFYVWLNDQEHGSD